MVIDIRGFGGPSWSFVPIVVRLGLRVLGTKILVEDVEEIVVLVIVVVVAFVEVEFMAHYASKRHILAHYASKRHIMAHYADKRHIMDQK